MLRIHLPRVDAVSGTFAGSLPPSEREGWHLLALHVPRQGPSALAPGWIATVRFTLAEGDELPQDVALVRPLRHRLFGAKLAVAFLRGGIRTATIRLYGVSATPMAISLILKPLPRFLAVAGVWLQNPQAFRSAGGTKPGRPRERFRNAIVAAATRGQEVPRSYAAWSQMFDTWSAERVEAISRVLPASPNVMALVFGDHGAKALAATLASLEAQHYRPSRIVVIPAGGLDTAARDAGTDDWVAVIQAGEILAPHALLLLVSEASRNESLEILFADEDRLLPDGRRGDPLFKPQPSLTLMCSGLLSRGVWLIRPALRRDADWAECLRLQAWFRLHAVGRAQATWRVPYVLTHRRADAGAAPPEALAAVVNAHLRSAGIQAVAGGAFPLRLRWHAGDLARRKVSIIVPSRLKGQTQVSCLTDVLASTRHPNFEMLVVVTQDTPLDEEQGQAAERLRADPRVRVELLRCAGFNYSAANNFAAHRTSGEFLCLLNDDVSTLDGDWLERMVAAFSDAQVGIVGAKLYYPDMTVQHAGAIMGLAGLVEHASRFLPRGEPGYAWRGVLDQEFSCVTGACMLVRRSVYEALRGLDEGLPTAFNDVDFCLRARGQGHSVVFAASVELIHHETISFGHHYAHDREREMADVHVMRRRWAEVCRADPFHSPNLSLMGKAEWELACPPRTDVDWRELT